jgi:hypothetical protein
MANMNADEARHGLAEAQRSYDASARPALPRWVPPVCGVLVAVAVAVPGLGYSTIWWKLAAIAIAVTFAVGARRLLTAIRSRRGIKGIRGPARRTLTSLGTSGVAYLIGATRATPPYRWVFIVMGLVVGVIVWISLSKQVRP